MSAAGQAGGADADLAVVGAGAAGLMAAIQAAREAPGLAVAALDGAKTLGAKILVAGGGRCNVTHHAVDERAFAGSTPAAIRKVLRRFDVPATRAFFAGLGVELKRETTGKLFPVTDRARTVLDALLRAAADAGVRLLHPWRVESLAPAEGGFELAGPAGVLRARRVVLATGGRSLPKSGSDGHGYALARGLGHTLTPRIFPALVPLLLPPAHFLCALRGVASDVALTVRDGGGRARQRCEGPLLCTHFGVSGPAVLDASRYLLDARAADEAAALEVDWWPEVAAADLDRRLVASAGGPPADVLAPRLPARLAAALCAHAGVPPGPGRRDLPRARRAALVAAVKRLVLPVTGDRGWRFAEVTAGGVPLRELRLDTLESRVCPRLHLCGEILDVDGRIGGFNFQWAWSSGTVAGRGAAGA